MHTDTLGTFYHAPGTCAQAVHIALLEAGARFELVWLDFARQQQREPGYLRINAKGRVPALVTPRGLLTEVPALLTYVAQTYPEATLAPLDDAFELARMQSFNAYLASTVHVAHAHFKRGSRWADEPEAIEAMRRKVKQNMTDAFDYIESEWLVAGPWLLGGSYSVADPYLFTIGGWLEGDGVDVARYPLLLAHRERMQARPAVAAALAARPDGA